MGKKHEIEDLRGKGIMARVTDTGKMFSTYRSFARDAGYSDAAEFSGGEKADKLEALARNGGTFKALARGNHCDSGYSNILVYVIESKEGDRFLVASSGLDISEPRCLSDMYEDIKDIIDEIRKYAYDDGYEQGKFDEEMGRIDGLDREELSKEVQQERRDRIVERAKNDVEKLKSNCQSSLDNNTGVSFWPEKAADFGGTPIHYVDFVVNKEKRTVASLIKSLTSSRVYYRGIAKCAPGDCFNVHIGKVIALRRALGLEVPDEYLNAPQPTEVRVGDVVKSKGKAFPMWGNGKVTSIESDKVSARGYFVKSGSYAYLHEAEIIDDSREE